MAALKNTKHERFAQMVASGMSATEAYSKAGYKAKDVDTAGPRLSGNVGVAQRIAELKEKQSDKAEMSRDDLRKYLIEILLIPVGKIDEMHKLCQEYTRHEEGGSRGMLRRGNAHRGNEEESEAYTVVKIKMPNKLDAAAQLAKLCGWNEPEKVEHSGSFEELLKVIRDGR